MTHWSDNELSKRELADIKRADPKCQRGKDGHAPRKLMILLEKWEQEPDVMLFGAGAYTTGEVAKWIREAIAGCLLPGDRKSSEDI